MNKNPPTSALAEDIKEILRVASFAPSSHNTQPWTVKSEGQNLIVGYDANRQLSVGDPEKRELFISLGCFIETTILAAKDKGYEVTYSLTIKGKDVATLSFKPEVLKKSNWTRLILARRSDRRTYNKVKIPSSKLTELQRLTSDKAYLWVSDAQKDIDFLAKVTHEATLEIMSNQDFRNELSSWVRNNWTKKPDGMPGYTQGMPGPVSLLAKFFVKKIKKVPADQAKKDAKRVTHSSAVGLICVNQQTPHQWVEAGRLYQAVCLYALRNDIKTSAISAAVILPRTSQQIVKTLGLEDTPVALMRFGYTKNTVKSAPRLDVLDFYLSN